MEIRSLEAHELEPFLLAMSGPFGFDVPDESDQREALLDRMRRMFEPDRARGAFDGDRMVGTLGAFSLEMTVPGGAVPVVGTTQVTVQVTHRRRGLLARMIRAHLEEAIERGDPAATLWASDSAIYGRFGYGMATWNSRVTIDRRHVDFHRLAPDPEPVDLAAIEDVRADAVDVYDRLRREVPGMMAHDEAWWDRILSDFPPGRGGAGKPRYAVARDGEGRPTGWIRYRVKDSDTDDGHPAQDIVVTQLYAVTPGAWAGLWRLALSHDFGRTIRANLRPIDDPIHWLLAGPRRARTEISDGLWLRVLDVPRLLAARTYSATGAVELTVRDPMGFVGGSYRLETEEGMAAVTRIDEGVVDLDVEDLGAIVLGGRSAVELALAGRVVGDSGAIDRLDRMVRWPRAPWSPVVF